MNDYILQVKNVSKSFLGVKALDGVNLNIKKGEVHALIGENGAGKSTLMNIIMGSLHYDSGEIVYKGKNVRFNSTNEAISAGISMIHQELSLIPTYTVSDNIWLGREERFRSGGIINKAKQDRATQELLERLGLNIDPDAVISDLNVASMQLVELARAISCDAEVLIMDEPTSALADKEIETLFGIIRNLQSKGVSIIYISHKMEELFRICERVTVFRDGKFISTDNCSDITKDELIKKIVGRELKEMYPKLEAEIGEPILEVSHLSRNGVFKDINFCVRKGEIVGFAGLAGAGRSEIAQSIFGIDKPTSGDIIIDGKKCKIKEPYDAVKYGIGMVTEDRSRTGAIASLSVKQNLSIAYLKQICNKINFINFKQEDKDCRKKIEELSIKIADIRQQIDSLSGGNQQKVIVGRWLLINPKILILDEPTRGIDVGAKAEIYKLINQLAQMGLAILLISSEMPEILGMSDRILVIREGRLVYECSRAEATQELIGKYAMGN